MRQSLADAGEALVTPQGGDFSIKREDQVLITETGHENLTKYPFDAALMGGEQAQRENIVRVTIWRDLISRECPICVVIELDIGARTGNLPGGHADIRQDMSSVFCGSPDIS